MSHTHIHTFIFTYIYTHTHTMYIHITHQNNTEAPKAALFFPLKKGRFSLSFQRRFSGKNHLKPCGAKDWAWNTFDFAT